MAKKNNYFKTFCKVSRKFGSTFDREELLNLIVESAIDTMQGKAASLFLFDKKRDFFVKGAQRGLSKDYLHSKPIDARKVVQDIIHGGHIAIYDATTDPHVENHEAKIKEGIASILVVPVLEEGRAIGILALYTATPRKFTKEEIEFLTALAEQGGIAIQHARLVRRIRENTRIFHDLAASINASLDVKKIMGIMSEDIAQAFDVKAVSVRLLDEDERTLKLVASYGLSDEYLKKGPVSAEKSIAQALEGKPVVVKNAAVDSGVQYRDEKKEEGIVSILCVPIKTRDKVVGVLRLYCSEEREFTEDEIMFATALAHQGGLAIQNASLYLRLKEDMKDLKEDMWSHRSWF